MRFAEAGYNELLVSTTNDGGVPSIYNEKECVLHDRRDHKKLSEHILAVVDNPRSYDALRKNMCSKVYDFTWEGVKRQWLNLLKSRADQKIAIYIGIR